MSKGRVTSRQVAERAGVSRTTVSFVLNGIGHGKVSDATRQRVLDAARDLGYVPDAAARTLVSGKTATVGLLIARAEHIAVDAFVPQTLHSMRGVCASAGYRLLVETSDIDGPAYDYRRLVDSRQIDGLVVLNPDPEDPRLGTLIDDGYPLVLIGAHRNPRVATVSVDSVAGMRAVTDHLIQLGHRDIGFIHYRAVTDHAMGGRMSGYSAALLDAGIAPIERYVRSGDFSAESGYLAMESLLKEGSLPTAMVCGNDTIAIGAMAAVADAGLRVPEDVAVVGFDDIPLARYLVPPLTTVRLPAAEMARRAGELVIRQIDGMSTGAQRLRLSTELVVRRSCGSAAVGSHADSRAGS